MSFDIKKVLEFKNNVGEKEAKYRLYGGIAAVLVSIFLGNVLLLIVGVILIATGYSGYCPIYSGLDKNSLASGDSSDD